MVITLEIKQRDKSSKARALRRQGIIPATIYGSEIESQSIQLDAKNFSRVAFEDYTHLMELEEPGQGKHEVLIKNIQKDCISGQIQNIEFYKITKGHKLTTKVILKFVGNSEAVKMGADLVIVHKEAHIKCFPRHIPAFLEVDLAGLVEAESTITFADLKLGEELELLDPPQEVVCKAETKRKDHTLALEEEAAAQAAEQAAAAAATAATAPQAAADENKKAAS
jgi:large subunit ribosomal protein L25